MSATTIIPSRLDLFNAAIKKDMQDHVRRYGRYAGKLFWTKAIFLLTIWSSLYTYIVFYSSSTTVAYLLSLIWGLSALFIIFNIGHDAVHGVVSDSKKINNVLKYTFNLVGGNAYSWKLKHNIAHHVHTNMEGLDFDTDLSPLMRLSPNTPYRPQYKWQHITCFLIYPLLSLLIIFIADFKIFGQAKKAQHVQAHPTREWVILLCSKCWYLLLVFVIPLLYSPYTFQQILFTFLSYQVLCGIVIAAVFMPSHYFNGSMYFENKNKDYNWFEHQLSTTMDLSPDSRLVSFLLGGLNLNVAHHLYPHFCHTHYFELTKAVKKRAAQYEINYHALPYSAALVDHLKFLKALAT